MDVGDLDLLLLSLDMLNLLLSLLLDLLPLFITFICIGLLLLDLVLPFPPVGDLLDRTRRSL